MTDRSAALEAAVRAQDKLIAEAQRLLKTLFAFTRDAKRRNRDIALAEARGAVRLTRICPPRQL
jgi:hypothetical protein